MTHQTTETGTTLEARAEDLPWAVERVTRMCASALVDAQVYRTKLLKGFGYPNETFRAAQDYRALSIVLTALQSARTEGKREALEQRDELLAELRNIAEANPHKWEADVRDQFQQWAQNRARLAINRAQTATPPRAGRTGVRQMPKETQGLPGSPASDGEPRPPSTPEDKNNRKRIP